MAKRRQKKITVREDGTIRLKVSELLDMSQQACLVRAYKKHGAGRRCVVLIEEGGETDLEIQRSPIVG